MAELTSELFSNLPCSTNIDFVELQRAVLEYSTEQNSSVWLFSLEDNSNISSLDIEFDAEGIKKMLVAESSEYTFLFIYHVTLTSSSAFHPWHE